MTNKQIYFYLINCTAFDILFRNNNNEIISTFEMPIKMKNENVEKDLIEIIINFCSFIFEKNCFEIKLIDDEKYLMTTFMQKNGIKKCEMIINSKENLFMSFINFLNERQ